MDKWWRISLNDHRPYGQQTKTNDLKNLTNLEDKNLFPVVNVTNKIFKFKLAQRKKENKKWLTYPSEKLQWIRV